MAYDKVIDSSVLDAGLKQIADAIREKGGTTDGLAFPQAMTDAIAAISAGYDFDGAFEIHSGTFTYAEQILCGSAESITITFNTRYPAKRGIYAIIFNTTQDQNIISVSSNTAYANASTNTAFLKAAVTYASSGTTKRTGSTFYKTSSGFSETGNFYISCDGKTVKIYTSSTDGSTTYEAGYTYAWVVWCLPAVNYTS